MAIGNLVPWRWGSLRGFDDDRSLDSFRTEMETLHRNIDRLFADVWGGSFAPSLLSDTWASGKIMPRLDVAEDEKAFRVSVELPGMNDKDVAVTVPEKTAPGTEVGGEPATEVRESLRVQALLGEIGSRMGMQIWLPRADRAAALAEWRGDHSPVLEAPTPQLR